MPRLQYDLISCNRCDRLEALLRQAVLHMEAWRRFAKSWENRDEAHLWLAAVRAELTPQNPATPTKED